MSKRILFCDDWRFHGGDIEAKTPLNKGAVYRASKAERKLWGPAARNYCDEDDSYEENQCTEFWEKVNIPHDYIIKQTPEEKNNNALGYFNYHNAWYRKHFSLDESYRDKRITLFFEGVATSCEVYVNGCFAARNFCGYNSFEADITNIVDFDRENVVAVYVKTEDIESWWYAGGGIYRKVYLEISDNVAVDRWGVFVHPEKLDDDLWNVCIDTTVRNDTYEDENVKIIHTVTDKDGCEVLKLEGEGICSLRDKSCIKADKKISSPLLWNTDSPNLYYVKTEVFSNGTKTDESETHFGFRSFEYVPDKGFFVNGKKTFINGVCAHQDFGLTGKAIPDNIYRYRIEMIKQMGANGYRTSHYPHSEATMDALDELGFIVMDETRWFNTDEDSAKQLEMLIKRDRNRPCVFFWSVGNEEPFHITDKGKRINKAMIYAVKKLDDTRPIMTAVSNSPTEATVYDDIDWMGINYNLDSYDILHERYPEKPLFASECCATGTTRGWYFDNCTERSFSSAYDKDTTKWFLGREKTWSFLTSRSYIIGGYQWTSFEHRGECVWPRLCSISGAIDMYMQKKDAFYLNQSMWTEKPMLHLLPHWNFEGMEGEVIKVNAYTNCDDAELFLNGKSCGRQKVEKYSHAEWQVKYEKGEIYAVGYIKGEKAAEDIKKTSGKPENLALRLDNRVEVANGEDIAVLTCYCTDKDGNEVYTASPFVRFYTNSLGSVIGTGSDISDHVPPHIPDRKMRAGSITVGVKVGNTGGTLKVYAESEGLKSCVFNIELK